MSFASWCKDYYPQTAATFAERRHPTKLQAVRHCLRKWRGLQPEAIKRHGVKIGWVLPHLYEEVSEEILVFDADSCALCQLFADKNDLGCEYCPVLLVNEGVPCDDPEEKGPFIRCLEANSPKPAIELLERLEHYLTRKSKKRRPK